MEAKRPQRSPFTRAALGLTAIAGRIGLLTYYTLITLSLLAVAVTTVKPISKLAVSPSLAFIALYV